MSKNIFLTDNKVLLKSIFILLFSLLFSFILFYIKNKELKQYYIYDGIVVGFTNVNVSENVTSFKRKSYKNSYSRDIPIICYTNSKGEKITYEEGGRVLFSSFKLHEKIRVLENKKNKYKTNTLSFFYFWLHINEFIIYLLSLFIFYVFISAFIFKDFYISDF